MPNIRKKHNKRRAFSRNSLFLDYLFAENRILELTLVIRSMKREEEKWWPHVGTSSYQNYANSAFLLLYSSIPILPFLIYPTILCKFFTLAKKFAEVRIIVVFLFVFFFFFKFSCVLKVIRLLILAPLKKISWKESKFKTMKRRNASDDEERGHKKLREQAVYEFSSSQESSSTQSVKEILRPGIEQKRVQQDEESFSRSQVMLLFRIGLRSCQILVIFVKCGR